MTLQERITEDMKGAMRAKDSARLTTIRMLTAAIKQKEVDERVDARPTPTCSSIVDKLVKQRRDSVGRVREGRPDGSRRRRSRPRSRSCRRTCRRR